MPSRVGWVAVSVSVVFVLATFVHPGSGAFWTAFVDIGESGTPFVAAACCWLTARRCASRERVGWALIGIGAASWGVGQLWWTIVEVGMGHAPLSPSVCDAGFLLSPVLTVCGLLLFVETPAARHSRVRGLFEAALITGGLFVAAWVVWLQPEVAASHASLSEQLLTLAYPILDTVTLAVLVFTATRARVNRSGRLGLVGAGVAGFAVADSVFWYLTSVKNYEAINPSESGWFIGFLLIAFGARQSHRVAARLRADAASAGSPATWLARRRWLAVIVPELIALGGLAIATADHLIVGSPTDGTYRQVLTGLAAVALLHGLSVLVENNALTTRLEERIAQRTAELAQRERHFEALVEHSSDATLVVTADHVIYSATQSADVVFGRPAAQLVGRSLDEFDGYFAELLANLRTASGAPGYVRHVTWQPRTRDRHQRVLDSHITNLLDDPDVNGHVINTRDVTERVQLEREIRHQAFHDSLTGLANRALFRDRGEHALARASRNGSHVAVILIDLDGFKHVNDSLGHHTGDDVLRETSGRLAAAVRPGDTLARLGGDEFAMLVEDVEDVTEALDIADRVRVSLADQQPSEQQPVRTVTASIGVTVSDSDTPSIEQLVRDADIAMYVAKSNGKNAVQRFERWMHDRAAERFRIQNELAGGLERGEFVLHYQPCWSVASERLVGFEALVRWDHPTLGRVPPDRFIPVAEESGMIVPLGMWVIEEATRQLAEWQRQYPEFDGMKMAVNVSARQILDPQLADRLGAAIVGAGIDPHQVVLEITESVLVQNPREVAKILHTIKKQGIRLAIDDFGTGYSSLSYLQGLPIDILKVDRSFVSGQGSDDAEGHRMLGAIIKLAQTLGLQTIAEGVEDVTQAAVLSRHRCDLAQGYLWARPLSAAETVALVLDLSGGASVEVA